MNRVKITTEITGNPLGFYKVVRHESKDIFFDCQLTIKPKSTVARYVDDNVKNLLNSLKITYSIAGFCGKWNGKQYDSAIVFVNQNDVEKVESKFEIIKRFIIT